jgi:WD40 repeat protein
MQLPWSSRRRSRARTVATSTLWPFPPMVRPSCQAPTTGRSKSGMQVYLSPPYSSPSPKLSAPTLATASLELKAEKQSAHSFWVNSVAFFPDGSTIVSGSRDQTIKVWDAGTLAYHIPHPQPNTKRLHACYSFPGAQGGESERTQQLRELRGLLTRWIDHRVGLEGQDDQSLGCSQLPCPRRV